MEKIIIFTKYSSLKFDNPSRILNNIPLIEMNNFIVFDEHLNEFKISTSINDGLIFFVKDEIGFDMLNTFIGAFDRKKIGILKHKKPDASSKINFNEFDSCAIGEHESWGKFYPSTLEIMSAKDNNKFTRLQSAIFKSDPEIDLWLKPFEDIAPNITDKTLQAAAAQIKVDVKAKYNL